MASFDSAIPYLLQSEGGYSNRSEDRGGETNWGITEKLARSYGYQGEMIDLPLDFAKDIYKAEFWKFDDVASQAVSTKLLDMAANFGLGSAVRILQQSLNDLVDPPVSVDGGWGPDTLDAVNTTDPNALLGKLSEYSAARYKAIVAKDPTQSVFLKGWLARAMRNPVVTGGVSAVALVIVAGAAWALWDRK